MPKATTPVVSLISGALLFFASTTWAQITPSDAKSLIGKREIVCGQVASANFAVRTKGQPTFLNLDRAYPNQIFTVLIWGNNRVKFGGAPERIYSRKKVCVSGMISSYKGAPEIVVTEPSQIRIAD